MEIKGTYRDGVFVPDNPVDLPDGMRVQLTMRIIGPDGNEGSLNQGSLHFHGPPDLAEVQRQEEGQRRIMEILMHRYDSGQTDTAERHNEHQP